ncbi:hypothetical protein [Fluviispira multicolorata]|uniref:Uncharacterized protein n=1 Tax=Fluviispira multicolorata TaxID=2654512 RepID=A0A833N3X9_9BACT|nr:hypothetical protein [Fluviispira multicolorata]KAB8029701.1 hypothetical protein GCL57_09150 [Fluviispira multicolorata]
MNAMPVTQVDGAYYSIPLITLLFGSAASIFPLMAIQNIIFFTFIIFLIEIFRKDKNTKKQNYLMFILNKIKGVLFKNPIIFASIAGFIFALPHIPLADKIIQILHFFGASSSPVALFSLGLSISTSIMTVWIMKEVQRLCFVLLSLKSTKATLNKIEHHLKLSKRQYKFNSHLPI